MKLPRLDKQNKKQISMVEVAYEILRETGQVHAFEDLLASVQDYLGMSQAELEDKMAVFYTELNADGSFISVGENRWALRAWYPIDAINEEIVSSIDDDEIKSKHKSRKRTNVFSTDDDDMIDYNSDDPEDEDLTVDDDLYDDDEDGEEEEDAELRDYASDLGELGDEEADDDAIEDQLHEIDEDDLDDDEDDF
ncbi:DNA-directed RNA polymerase subunit delta [Aerococcus urinaehominis]|uniref:Probable DNA-directed RNA polymerase subunit delta n=1 Tax=Aerococcus urinaehominis TaxID=128944 RepID=A0A0X8FKY4_9LACT|nr:DNA-directed RNA polymerase subunit delta [Aerococcus urinaehominis]SDM32280.1 DNA-directed RNA polymerase subunit delta [Aerococcus urinaehominis]